MPEKIVIEIDSQIRLGTQLAAASAAEVKDEPMLFSCSPQEAFRLGGPLTARFLNALPFGWLGGHDVIVDSRVHMLMEGWYPCIPGWHHDDVPRSRGDGQPNYISPEYETEHCMWLAGDKIASTEFAIGRVEMPEVPLGEIVYGKWSLIVNRLLSEDKLTRVTAPMHTLVHFNWQTFHQGVAATGKGWRFFIRASKGRVPRSIGEVRRQVQVYLKAIEGGW
jgi:hypothetical protein